VTVPKKGRGGGITKDTKDDKKKQIKEKWQDETKERKTKNRRPNKAESRRKEKEKEKVPDIRIAYCNIQRKGRTAFQELDNLISQEKWDIVGVVETNWREGYKKGGIKGYKLYKRMRRADMKGGGGIAVWIKEDYKGFDWEQDEGDRLWQKDEICWIIIPRENQDNVAIGFTYLAPEGEKNVEWNNSIEEQLTQDMASLREAGNRVMLIGDFNGHIKEGDGGVRQGDNRTDTNGQRIKNIMRSQNLIMMNKSTKCQGKWTFMRKNQKSIVDYVLADEDVAEQIKGMIIDDEAERWTIDSDHSWIQVELEGEMQKKAKIRKERRWKIHAKTNWQEFQREMAKELVTWEAMEGEDESMADIAYSRLVEVLNKVGQRTIGKSQPTYLSKRRKTPRGLRNLIGKRNKEGKKWRKSNKTRSDDEESKWKEYRKAKAAVFQYRKIIRTRKSQAWKIKLLEQGEISSRQLWQDLKREQGSKGIEAVEKDRRIITEPEQVKREVQEYMETLGRESQTQADQDNGGQGGSEENVEELNQIFSEEITDEECMKAIKGLKNGKATGWDGIPNEFIKKGGQAMHRVVRKVFNMFIKADWVPPKWAQEKVTLLHKGGSTRDLDNYRGISIGNTLGKLFAKILAGRLEPEVEKRGWLGEIQAGFRRGRNTVDNLFIISSIMERAHKEKTPLYMAFIDFRKAYDRVWRDGLWKELRSIGLGGKFLTMIQMLYQGHSRRVLTCAGYTDWIQCDRGVKQGCILSPLLFALYIARIKDVLQGQGVQVGRTTIPALLFADDLVIIARSEEELMVQLQKVQHFTTEKKLEINYKKTEIMKVGPGTKEEREWFIVENATVTGQIKETNVYKYLGIKLGRGRIYQYHTKGLLTGVNRKIGMMKHQAYGTSDPSWAGRVLWSRAVRPGILYGAEVVTYPQTMMKKLETVQNRVGRWISGVSRRTSCSGLRTELGWNRMEDEVQKMKVRYWIQLMKMKENRWPRQALQMIVDAPYTSAWYKELIIARDRLENPWRTMLEVNWKMKLKKEWKRSEGRREDNDMENRKSLQVYPKRAGGSGERYLDGSKESKIMCKLRLGDVQTTEDGKCEKCGKSTQCLAVHILRVCVHTAGVRRTVGLETKYQKLQEKGFKTNQATKIILEDTRKESQRRICRVFSKWECAKTYDK
jgi:hypothetical protein